MNILELHHSQVTKKLIELERLKTLFKTQKRWDDARKLDADLFVENYGEEFLEYTSMDFNSIIESIARKEKLWLSLLERINS